MNPPTFWQRVACVLLGGHHMDEHVEYDIQPVTSGSSVVRVRVVECDQCGYRPKAAS